MLNSRTWSNQRIPRILVFAGTALLLITACNKQSSPAPPNITIEHEVTPQPAHVGTATITLRLSDTSRKAVTGAQITLEGNMSHAGMSPVFATAKEIEAGRYQAQLELTMGGDWIILLHLTLSDGHKLEQQFEISGVRAE